MSNMFHLKQNQKMFIKVRDGVNEKRTYLGYIELETDDFFLLRIDDKKHAEDYFYIIPKNLIIGCKLYWD